MLATVYIITNEIKTGSKNNCAPYIHNGLYSTFFFQFREQAENYLLGLEWKRLNSYEYFKKEHKVSITPVTLFR